MASYHEELHTFIGQSNLLDPEMDECGHVLPGEKPGDPMYDRHMEAFEAACDLLTTNYISRSLLLATHKEMTRDLPWYERNQLSGRYRPHAVQVGGWSPPEGFIVPTLIEGRLIPVIEQYLNDPKGHFRTKKRAWTIHHLFECIHPFADSNGKVGRTLMNAFMRIHGRSLLLIYPSKKAEYISHIVRFQEQCWLDFLSVKQTKDSLPF